MFPGRRQSDNALRLGCTWMDYGWDGRISVAASKRPLGWLLAVCDSEQWDGLRVVIIILKVIRHGNGTYHYQPSLSPGSTCRLSPLPLLPLPGSTSLCCIKSTYTRSRQVMAAILPLLQHVFTAQPPHRRNYHQPPPHRTYPLVRRHLRDVGRHHHHHRQRYKGSALYRPVLDQQRFLDYPLSTAPFPGGRKASRGLERARKLF